MKDTAEIWILKGYEVFALVGEAGLKIEKLSKEVAISKSSFYHHFADLEVFMEKLLEHHLQQSSVIADKERLVKRINPELISILIEHRIDLLFNRQLRFNAADPRYKIALLKSNEIIGRDFVRVWLTDTGLKISTKQAEAIFELALENFFLQINKNNLNHEWLEDYFEGLKRITRNFEA